MSFFSFMFFLQGGITQHDDDGLFMVSLLGLEVVDCVLKFKPTEVRL